MPPKRRIPETVFSVGNEDRPNMFSSMLGRITTHIESRSDTPTPDLVDRLAVGIAEWGMTGENLRSAAMLAGALADSEVISYSKHPKKMSKILALTKDPRFATRHYAIVPEELSRSRGLAYYESEPRTIGWDPVVEDEQSEVFRQKFSRAGIAPRHPDDPRLLNITQNLSHEVGHTKFAALSRLLCRGQRGEVSPNLLASRIYIGMHPEMAITREPVTAISAIEESLVDTYSYAGGRHMLRLRGYTATEITRLYDVQARDALDYVAHSMTNRPHEIDFLDDPVGMREYRRHRRSKGELGTERLGYGLSQSVDRLDEALLQLGTMVQHPENVSEILDNEDTVLPDVRQAPEIAEFAATLRSMRRKQY